MKHFRIAIGSDHAGFATKQKLIPMLLADGHRVLDVGTHSEESCDYPDFAYRVAQAVESKKHDRGILICGTGIGMCIAANKAARHVRAAVCWDVDVAVLAAQHNWANVLCLPGRFVSIDKMKKIIRTWLKTPFEKGGRHQRRIKKISKFDAKS